MESVLAGASEVTIAIDGSPRHAFISALAPNGAYVYARGLSLIIGHTSDQCTPRSTSVEKLQMLRCMGRRGPPDTTIYSNPSMNITVTYSHPPSSTAATLVPLRETLGGTELTARDVVAALRELGTLLRRAI